MFKSEEYLLRSGNAGNAFPHKPPVLNAEKAKPGQYKGKQSSPRFPFDIAPGKTRGKTMQKKGRFRYVA
ncbi:MAG: hypothetical protein IKM45_06745 [Opitutales bacterium]|nr:hypothetical protein [Opitutales bacterium]